MSLVGIIGAMEEEVSKLKEQMIDVSVKEKPVWNSSGAR